MPSCTALAHDPATLIETGVHIEDMPPPDALVARFAYLRDDYNALAELVRAVIGYRRQKVSGKAATYCADRSMVSATGNSA